MAKKVEEKEEIMIRLNLNSIEDQPIYDYFIKIKDHLGAKTFTEVARICIKQAYDQWFKKKIENSK